MEQRTRSSDHQIGYANGLPAVQNPGAGTKRDLDSRGGMQLDPDDHGSGGEQARNGTAVHQFQRGPTNTRSISADDRDARSIPFNNSTTVLRTASNGYRSTSSSGSTRPIRAKATQAKAQTLRSISRTQTRSQTPNPERAYVKLSDIRRCNRCRAGNASPKSIKVSSVPVMFLMLIVARGGSVCRVGVFIGPQDRWTE